MTFYELYRKIDEKFPASLSCDWDNDGIMCAPNLEKQVKDALIALDITDDVVDYAIKNGRKKSWRCDQSKYFKTC